MPTRKAFWIAETWLDHECQAAPGQEGVREFALDPDPALPAGALEFWPRHRETKPGFPMKIRIESILHPTRGAISLFESNGSGTFSFTFADGGRLDSTREDDYFGNKEKDLEWMGDGLILEAEVTSIPDEDADALAAALRAPSIGPGELALADRIVRAKNDELIRYADEVLRRAGTGALPVFRKFVADQDYSLRVRGAYDLAGAAPDAPETMVALLHLVCTGDEPTRGAAAARAVELGCPASSLGDQTADLPAEATAALIRRVLARVPGAWDRLLVLLKHRAENVRAGARLVLTFPSK